MHKEKCKLNLFCAAEPECSSVFGGETVVTPPNLPVKRVKYGKRILQSFDVFKEH